MRMHRGCAANLGDFFMEQFHGTTIVSVRRQTPNGVEVALGGDGQVT